MNLQNHLYPKGISNFRKFGFLLLCFLCTNLVLSQENCSNGLDDDNDGKIDLNDPDCSCNNASMVSMLQNSSFEEFIACPDHFSQGQMLATHWFQGVNTTSDYLNNCDFVPDSVIEQGLNDFPSGNGAIGALYQHEWQEYLGVEFDTPLLAGTTYQLTFQIAALTTTSWGLSTPYPVSIFEPVEVTLFGHPDTGLMPLYTGISPNIDFPDWINIGHVRYTPTEEWQEITITFTPAIDIRSMMIGPPETLPDSYVNLEFTLADDVQAYIMYDDMMLNKASDFKVNLTSTGSLCEGNLVLQSNLTGSFSGTITYQWYKDNIAISGATNPTLPIPFGLTNDGAYCVRISNGTECYISNKQYVTNTIAPADIIVDYPDCIILTGSILVSTPAAAYSFDGGITWLPNAYSGPLQPGRYGVMIRDASGCVSESVSVIMLPPVLNQAPAYDIIQPNCATGTGLTITITSPGTAFSFDDGVTWTTNNVAADLPLDVDYFVMYRDLTGCLSVSNHVYVNALPIPGPPDITVNPPMGCANNFGTITVTTTADTYSFDNGNTWSSNAVSDPLPPGTYQVRIKNVNGCPSYLTEAVINLPPDAPVTPTVNVSQPVNCASPYGIVTVTDTASQYSFDNGVTWGNNPGSGNLIAGVYQIKVRNSANCESAAVTATIIAPTDYPAAPAYTVDQPDCTQPQGSITINSPGSAFSIDNGVTWSTDNSFMNLNPATYAVRIKSMQGCMSPAANAVVMQFTSFTPTPAAASPQSFCVQDQAELLDVAITGQNIKWYNAATGGNQLTSTTLLTNGTYYATQTVNNCESPRIAIVIDILNTAAPSGDDVQSFCSTQFPSLNDLAINGNNIKWYTTATGNVLLAGSTPLTDNVTYYASQTLNGCESTTRFAVTASLINTLNANDYSETICDDGNDGTEISDLADYNDNLIADVSNCTFDYYTSMNGAILEIASEKITDYTNYELTIGAHTIYVRITSGNGCHQVVQLDVALVSKPVLAINDVVPMCQSANVVVNAGTGFSSYSWSTGATSSSIVISQPGNYSVTVTRNYGSVSCSTTKNFAVVISNTPIIAGIESQDWTEDNNVIKVNTTTAGEYEFSIDGVYYQDSNVFTGLHQGSYTVYVRDKNGCGIAQEEVFLLMYPNFFTPNGDGSNDNWSIAFSYSEPGMRINIFDRYGKLLKVLHRMEAWDGQYNGHELPSDDYWFVVTRANGKEYRGHFSLKR